MSKDTIEKAEIATTILFILIGSFIGGYFLMLFMGVAYVVAPSIPPIGYWTSFVSFLLLSIIIRLLARTAS